MKLSFLILLAFALNGVSATYYVDFEGGSDAANGTSTLTPWKHSPGDNNSTGAAASTLLVVGDMVNFKGGVSYNGTITTLKSGTPNSPLIFQGSSAWGTGRAIMDGTVAGVTNINPAFALQGSNIWVSGFEIRDYRNSPLFLNYDNPRDCVITNNVIHHIGVFPFDNSNIYGEAILNSFCSGTIVISNLIYDCNYNAIGGQSATNLAFLGNELYAVQSHGFQEWAYGYTLVAGNFFHDETNTDNHSDAIQILSVPAPGIAVVCGNTFSNNVDDINFNLYNPTWAAPPYVPVPQGKIYVFNNVMINTTPSTDLAIGWQNGCAVGIYDPVDTVMFFNNTWLNKNAGWGSIFWTSIDPTNTLIQITNILSCNNLFWDCTGGLPPASTNRFAIQRLVADFNVYTNYLRNNACMANVDGNNNPQTLAGFQAAFPGYETHSTQNPVGFVDLVNFNLRPVSGSGTTTGTNLTSTLPTLTVIPLAFRPDPSKDILGKYHTLWNAGAYEYQAPSAVLGGAGSGGGGTFGSWRTQ